MTVVGRRFLAASVCVVGMVAAAAAGPCQAQPSTPASVKLPLVYSTTPMTRNADLMLSASILSTSASEAGLAKVSPSLFRSTRKAARAARATKLVLFDVPVVFYFVGLNHEWGHQARATEYGMDSELLFTGTPWSSKPFELYALEQMSDHLLAVPSVHGGGMTASRVLKDRAEAIMLRSDRVAPGSALAAIISSLDTPAYAQANLYPGRFTEEWQPGDVSTYVRDWSDRQARPGQTSLDDIRSHIRTRSALNFLDAALWSETIGLLSDYVWRGETDVRMRWLKVGGVGLLPSVRYEFSPLGPDTTCGPTTGRSAPSALPTDAGPSGSARTGKSEAACRCRAGRHRGWCRALRSMSGRRPRKVLDFGARWRRISCAGRPGVQR